MAEPPVGGQIGATMEPMLSPSSPTRSASFFSSSSEASISKWGANNPMSIPSNFTPFTSALTVILKRSSSGMIGSEPSPLPTKPGQVALCNFGNVFSVIMFYVLYLINLSLMLLCQDKNFNFIRDLYPDRVLIISISYSYSFIFAEVTFLFNSSYRVLSIVVKIFTQNNKIF